jgi:hypothetical protein
LTSVVRVDPVIVRSLFLFWLFIDVLMLKNVVVIDVLMHKGVDVVVH